MPWVILGQSAQLRLENERVGGVLTDGGTIYADTSHYITQSAQDDLAVYLAAYLERHRAVGRRLKAVWSSEEQINEGLRLNDVLGEGTRGRTAYCPRCRSSGCCPFDAIGAD